MHWRALALIASALVLVLAVSMLWAFTSNTSTPPQAAVECKPSREAETFVEASVQASACGADIEVISERTPWETKWATPRGTTRLEVSTLPSRTEVTGEWEELDLSIVGTPGEGVLQVAAPVYPVELNAGGDAGAGAPLGSITREGRRLDVWFPAALPVPTIEESKAIYELAQGVRLIVSVRSDGTGFLPVVELADPTAAQTFADLIDGSRAPESAGAAGDLVFTTAMSEGLRLVLEEQGSVLVLEENDGVAFVSPPPVMWDSSGGAQELPSTVTEIAEADRTTAPAMNDVIKPMPVALDGASIVVSPDAAMLTSPGTVWPVYIDPGFNGQSSTENVAVRSGGFTGNLYNWNTVGGEGAGYCTETATCNKVFRQRLIWEYSGLSTIASLVGGDIVSAGFTVYGTHSYGCTARTTDMHMLGAISSSTQWGSLDWNSSNLVSSRNEYHSVNCGNTGWRTYDAKWALQQFADNNWSTLSLGLKARDESNMTGWKRFGHDATLSVEYNRAPDMPYDHQLLYPHKPVGCATGSGRPWVNTTTPTLSAYIKDPDGGTVDSYFEVTTYNSFADVKWRSGWTTKRASPSRFEPTVTSGLGHNQIYSWRVIAGDGSRQSGWQWCEFGVDVVKPIKPKIEPSPYGTPGVAAVYVSNAERGGIEVPGRFRLAPDTAADVVEYQYAFNDDTLRKTISAGEAQTVGVPAFFPQDAGKNLLHAWSVDRAGNVSDRTTYEFDVATPAEDAIWTLDDNAGTTAAGLGPKAPGPLTIHGAEWAEGPHQLFGSRDDDWALDFDGVNDFASSKAPAVDTAKSFTVSAHVRLDSAGTGTFTALSQDGEKQSAFQLGYRPNCGTGSACWTFGMPDSSTGAPQTVVNSTLKAEPGEWVHLVGEHNATANTVRLWACEVGTPESPAVGEPIVSGPTTRTGSPWKSPEPFVIGRGQSGATGTNWWPGQIDNVRLFSDQILDESKLRRLCQGAEAESFGTGSAGADAVDPTVRESEVVG